MSSINDLGCQLKVARTVRAIVLCASKRLPDDLKLTPTEPLFSWLAPPRIQWLIE